MLHGFCPMEIKLKSFILLEEDEHDKNSKQTFNSRLLLGTGKYPSFEIQKKAVEESGAAILTFAVRRMNIFEESQPNFLEQLDPSKYKLHPNTAGAKTAEEAVRIAKLAKASGLSDMKLRSR